ncbi:MAG: C40 family peptidase [Lachnospiraceae bacterium]|nr:C40 family peptidase [Lachnospiraceae bacterium]
MTKVFWRAAILGFVGAAAICLRAVPAAAETVDGENSIGGITVAINNYYDQIDDSEEEVDTTELLSMEIVIPENIAIANVDKHLNIRKEATTSSAIVGILPKNAYCIVESVSDGWAKITSGKVSGYASTEYLYMGEEAVAKAKEVGSVVARVQGTGLRVRLEPSTEAAILTQVSTGEELEVLDDMIVNKNDPVAKTWVQVQLDGNTTGYVASEYVEITYSWPTATEAKELDSSVSSLRSRMVSFAKQYVGLKYVWGGTSLTTGADCSGFVLAIYKQFGITGLPRVSRDIAKSSKGTVISLSEAKPGDLVFYGVTSTGYIDHVAMYIGNGQVIHASGRKTGVKISAVGYRTPLKVVRFIND